MTASPYDLHLIVVSGAIRYATQAGQALQMRDIEAAHGALNKARRFIGEMIAGLDPQHSPEIVASLKSLFGYAWNALALADMDHDPQHVADALRVLEVHRDTWKELAPHAHAGRTAEAPAASATNAVNPAANAGKGHPIPSPHFATERTPATRLSRVM